MARHVDWEINIPLAPVPPYRVDAGLKEDYGSQIQESYLTQYLLNLGIDDPSEHQRKLVQRHAPLDKCQIEAIWADNASSAMAQQLRIVQPPIRVPRPPRREPQPAEVPEATEEGEGEEGEEWFRREKVANRVGEYQKYRSVVNPLVQDPSTIPLPARSGGLGSPRAASPDAEAGGALEDIMHRSMNNDQQANPALVRELQHLRQEARGQDAVSEGAPELVQWGKEGEAELDSLRRRFVMPFAAQRPVRRQSEEPRVLPWQSPELQKAVQISVPNHLAPDALEPINIQLEDIMAEAVAYTEKKLPLELLTTRRDPWLFQAIRRQLVCQEAVRLTGLVSHLLYWLVFGHLHTPEGRLPQTTRQSLVLAVQDIWAQLTAPASLGEILGRDTPAGRCFVIPVYILALKRGVENVFHLTYPKVFDDGDYGPAIKLQLVDQLNILVMNLFDPDCCSANFGALDSSPEAMRLWKKVSINQMKLGLTAAKQKQGKEFRTSSTMLLLMNSDGRAPTSNFTRKFLQKSSSDVVLAANAGIPPPEGASPIPGRSPNRLKPHLDPLRRQELYRSTCRRMASMGAEVVGSGGMSN